MGSKELLGKNEEMQAMALGVLKECESMEYEELRDRLELDDKEMQEVMRGIKFNGLAKERSRSTGAKFYIPDW